MDYTETLVQLEATDDALRNALGHLSTHCKCRGESICVPCELSRDSYHESERLRELRARMTAFLENVDHVLRCVTAYATGPDANPNDCPVCNTLADTAENARAKTRTRT